MKWRINLKLKMQALPTKDSSGSSGSSRSSTGLVPPSVTVQERGSRSKRKFQTDPPSVEPTMITPPPQNEGFGYEFSAGKFENTPAQGQASPCDMSSIPQGRFDGLKVDLGLSSTLVSSEVGKSQPQENSEEDEDQDADWSDLTETQLEELLISNLDMMFKSVINKIVGFGYTEEVATKAVLRSGLCYGCKDIMSNILDNTLAFLRNGQEIHPLRELFEDLLQLEKYTLAELVCVLRDIRPFFSAGDAMWFLLICDMNVSHACAMYSDPLGGVIGDGGSHNPLNSEAQLKRETKSSELNLPPIPVVPCSNMQFKARSITDVSNIRKPKNSCGGLVTEKESTSSGPDMLHKSISVTGTSQPSVSEGKFIFNRKVHSGSTKREYVLRQKSLLLERNYRLYGSKGSSRAAKVSGLGDLILDKKLKPLSDSSIKNASLTISKAVGIDLPQNNGNHNLSPNVEPSFPASFNLETVSTTSLLPKTNMQYALPSVNSQFRLPAANALPGSLTPDTEFFLSQTTRRPPAPVPVSSNFEPPNTSLGQWNPQYKKDKMILKLGPRVRELEKMIQEWTEWANQKVMQAARRLSKDKAELKTLRQEREEVERLKYEKQTLEESTMKKLAEMDNALYKASRQVEQANSSIRRLEVEKAALEQERVAAEIRAEESARSRKEALEREKKTLMKIQSQEKQKSMFQEDLVTEKRKVTALKEEVKQAKVLEEQSVQRWDREEKAREVLVMQANEVRKDREQIEASAKAMEESMKLIAENDHEKYKDDIQKLEKEISQLRLKTDSHKIAALRSQASNNISKMLTDFHDNTRAGVKRDRECVMCLNEEMSVVFLPCAHQVVCTACNELHEKQGMKDCPSCRSLIQQRIPVRYRE